MDTESQVRVLAELLTRVVRARGGDASAVAAEYGIAAAPLEAPPAVEQWTVAAPGTRLVAPPAPQTAGVDTHHLTGTPGAPILPPPAAPAPAAGKTADDLDWSTL